VDGLTKPADAVDRDAADGLPWRLAFLESVLDATHDAVFGVDEAGTVTSWNRSAERLFGRPGLEVLGEPAVSLFPSEAQPTIVWFLSIVASGDRIERFELDLERKGGMRTPVSLTLCPVTDIGGRVVGTAAVAHDLTEQRVAQATLAEAEARMREGEALAHVGRWLWDTQSGTVQWSEEVHRIHGIDPTDFGADLEAHVAAVVPADRARIVEALQRAVRVGRVFEEEYDIAQADGPVRRVYSRAEPTIALHGAVVGLRGTIRDTTEESTSR
jgi:PAS domain S-box-containing protein